MNIIHPRLLFTITAMIAGSFLPNMFVILSDFHRSVLAELPLILFAIVIILSHFFKQGRSGFVALLMLIAYLFIQQRLQVPLSIGSTRFEYYFLVCMIPWNLVFLSFIPERSVFSKAGVVYCCAIAWQIIIFYWLIDAENEALIKQILLYFDPWLYFKFDFTPLPAVFLCVLFVAILIVAILLIFRNLSSDQASLGSILAFSITLVQFNQAWISVSMFVISAAFLLFSVLHRSHEQAFLDELTLIPGRRALNSELTLLGNKYTIAMVDIDHFKKFNDSYGHDIGDNVLRMVASKLTEVNGRGRVYRYGGEEFTVLFKGKNVNECIDDLEEIRELVANYPFRVRDNDERLISSDSATKMRQNRANKDGSVQVTISIGVAERNKDTKEPELVIKAADGLLYQAKKKGRNCVCY